MRLAWLSRPTLLICIVGILIPNALSIGALVLGIGVPPRTAMVFAYATLAVAARLLRPRLIVPLYLALVAYDAVSTIALLFNLAPSEIGIAAHMVSELDI